MFGEVTFGEAMERPGVVTCRDGDCDHVRGTVVGVDAVGAATVGFWAIAVALDFDGSVREVGI